MAELILTKENFDSVIGGDKPVLVDFFATWCGPCKMMAPIIEEIAAERADSLVVGKIDVDEEGELANRFGISSIPTVILFKNGEVANTSVGLKSKDDLIAFFGI